VKHLSNIILGSWLLSSTFCLPVAADSDSGFIRVTPEQVAFKSGSGLEQVVLSGDPSKPGIYVLRVRFPPGVHSNPHFHSQDRHVTVIKGTWWMGVGAKLDINKAVALKAGSYALHPAGGIHWDGAGEEETIVQIEGQGPVETTQVESKMEPIGTWTTPKNPN
jgi:quercetin dioxygenase-like cupin family protein